MRVLLTCFAHNTHYHNLVPIGWALKAAGHEVRVAAPPALTEAITASGLTAVPVGDDEALMELIAEIGGDLGPYQEGLDFAETRGGPISHEHALGQQTVMSALCFSPLNSDATIDDTVALALSWRPDLVVWEPFTFAGPIAAHVSGAAHARVLWGPDVVGNARRQFLALSAEQPPSRREDPIAEWLGWTLERHGHTANAAVVEELLHGHATLDPTAESLRLPSDGRVIPFRFVPYNGRSVLPDWVVREPERPRVCFTLGVSARETYGRDAVQVSELLAGLGDLDAEIVATLDSGQVADAGPLPDNVRVVDFVPMDALLPTCSAVVHHGGAGTCFTATLHGVPQVVVAALWDAPLKGLQLQEAGAAVSIPPEKLDARTLRDAVARALSDRDMADSARKLRSEMLAQPTPAELVSPLERLVAERREDASGPLGYTGDAAELYDLVHQGKGKDYGRESTDLADLVRRHAPGADSLLDVACGTGMHLRHLSEHFTTVEGLELSPDMLAIARRRNPDAVLHPGDMRDFSLARRFSAITCMFSSIGHMADQRELDQAIARFAAHLEPGGVVVLEPWWFPEAFTPGFVGASTVEADGTTITRVSHSTREDGATRIEVHYLVAAPGTGVSHHEETHRITLFPREQYEHAFARAGLSAEFTPGGPSGRGLFVAVHRT
ncbi:activator-dependent family glycosyltransferase [Nocardiopsis sp. EMB25]|uniref:activator-dependent family glycosyltransferase n=1 Tax=Nocardiopsis sp. EMB25 TaxID=2835867 RepID=UPI002E127F36